MNNWIEWNENPLDERIPDCLIRALSFAEPLLSYDEILLILTKAGLRKDRDFRKYSVYADEIRTLTDRFTLVEIVFDDWNSTVATLAKETKGLSKNARAVCLTNDHAVAVCMGSYYDTFDSGRKRVKKLFVTNIYVDEYQHIIKKNGGTIKKKLREDN